MFDGQWQRRHRRLDNGEPTVGFSQRSVSNLQTTNLTRLSICTSLASISTLGQRDRHWFG